jgi:NADH-quinone oxidoreductase subunit C
VADDVTAGAGDEGEAGAGEQAEPARRHGAVSVEGCDMEVLHPTREQLVEVVRDLRDEDGFQMCLDLTAVDYLTYEGDRRLPREVEPARFEVVVTLISHAQRQRLRLRVQVPADDPRCPSLFDVHPGTEAQEREVFDMFGIEFTDHPDLTRILMPEDWDGHPLRKDAAIGRIPVEFKATKDAR